MAEDKKGFILYADQKELFDQLPNDKAGELIKHIFAYVNDEDPITEDLLIKLSFTPIKQQFKRDLKKWEKTREGRSKAGKASAEARKNKKQQSSTNLTKGNIVQQTLTKGNIVQQSSTNPTVIVNDNVKVIVNDNVINKSRIELKLDEFYKFRKEMKKTILESSKEAFKKSLIKLSCNDEQTAIEILEQSIANGWQGIFELKQQTNGTTNNKQVSKYHN